MNIHESYVSLETAKLLKQVGFDWKCCYCYDAETKDFLDDNEGEFNFNEGDDNDFYSAPTLAVAQRWLREVKNIFIEVSRYETINPLARELFEAVYDKTVDKSFAYVVNVLDVNNESIYDEDCFLTYEQALEAGINKCLIILLEEKK